MKYPYQRMGDILKRQLRDIVLNLCQYGMGRLNEFTVNILCNPEVIDINQDALGQCGAVVTITDTTYLMVKDLEDGGKAVELFNRSDQAADVTAPWPVLGLKGQVKVRDVWRQQDLGMADGKFTAEIPPHGVVMVRMATGPP